MASLPFTIEVNEALADSSTVYLVSGDSVVMWVPGVGPKVLEGTELQRVIHWILRPPLARVEQPQPARVLIFKARER